MKLVEEYYLQDAGGVSETDWFRTAMEEVRTAIASVVWPVGNDRFILHDEEGKKRGEGNGVTPIKNLCMATLEKAGWTLEEPLDLASVHRPGKLDAVKVVPEGIVAVEWETGNISSSHRALNKMCLGLLEGRLSVGVLIVPTRAMYRYLTDRVGNLTELQPYFPLWRAVPITSGVLAIIAVEHDGVSKAVPRIAKGTDGRALG